jgi:NAD(P)-dependent dehydrogenase (short-subunit alcohol dehydrogenase family)
VKLADKVAIVTGTSPNIGGGIAEGLAAEGARVVCVDVAADNAEQCAAAIRARGGQALGVVCDVTDERQVEAMVARAREAYGRVPASSAGRACWRCPSSAGSASSR